MIITIYQSSYVNYNWSNDFKNEKINSITGAITLGYKRRFSSDTNDHLYFKNTATMADYNSQQYANTINYVSV
jgi:hypothetical protein